MKYRIARTVATVLVLIASLPLAWRAAQTAFGSGAMLLVPTCCLALLFSLMSLDRAKRVGWFAYACFVALLLPTCPWWDWLILETLNVAQDFLRNSLTFIYTPAEVVARISMFVLPWVANCLIATHAARFVQRRIAPDQSDDAPLSAVKTFTIQDLLISVAVIAVTTAWLSGFVSSWRSHQQEKHLAFVRQFKSSFTSGDVTLLDEPKFHAQMSSHINFYRLSAPINKNDRELWAVWTYWSDENYPGSVSNFGYAEAVREESLPPFPVPLYLTEPMYDLTDGAPELKIKAELIKAPTATKNGARLNFVAQSDWGIECELVIRPSSAYLKVPLMKVAPKSGIVSWDVQLDPKFTRSGIKYEIICRPNPLYRGTTITGAVTISEPGG
ncbi:hypothetical protein OAG71_00690 [bacterium]|nr:hypothetical protein [bacterium]